MLVASGVFTRTTGAIDWLEWPSLKLIRRLNAGTDDHGILFTREAMAIEGDDLYLLPEDGPGRLFRRAPKTLSCFEARSAPLVGVYRLTILSASFAEE